MLNEIDPSFRLFESLLLLLALLSSLRGKSSKLLDGDDDGIDAGGGDVDEGCCSLSFLLLLKSGLPPLAGVVGLRIDDGLTNTGVGDAVVVVVVVLLVVGVGLLNELSLDRPAPNRDRVVGALVVVVDTADEVTKLDGDACEAEEGVTESVSDGDCEEEGDSSFSSFLFRRLENDGLPRVGPLLLAGVTGRRGRGLGVVVVVVEVVLGAIVALLLVRTLFEDRSLPLAKRDRFLAPKRVVDEVDASVVVVVVLVVARVVVADALLVGGEVVDKRVVGSNGVVARKISSELRISPLPLDEE